MEWSLFQPQRILLNKDNFHRYATVYIFFLLFPHLLIKLWFHWRKPANKYFSPFKIPQRSSTSHSSFCQVKSLNVSSISLLSWTWFESGLMNELTLCLNSIYSLKTLDLNFDTSLSYHGKSLNKFFTVVRELRKEILVLYSKASSVIKSSLNSR